MANQYKSSSFTKNARLRPVDQDSANQATMSIYLPTGTLLGIGDTLAFGILGENINVLDYSLDFGKIDSNASAALAGRFGTVTYAGAGATQTWTGSQDAVFIAAATVLQTNTTGSKNFSGRDGDNSKFAVTPYVVQTDQRILVVNISAAAGTNYLATAGTTVSLTVSYQYGYPDTYVTGVTGVSASALLGTPVTEQAAIYTYNNNAP